MTFYISFMQKIASNMVNLAYRQWQSLIASSLCGFVWKFVFTKQKCFGLVF